MLGLLFPKAKYLKKYMKRKEEKWPNIKLKSSALNKITIG